jgi:DNA modification methylase
VAAGRALRPGPDAVRASELERLLALADGEAASDEAEDEVPEPPEEPVSKPGDLWVLGDHRLLCGDATVLADVERVLGGQLADMTFTDPPYNVDYGSSAKDKFRGKSRKILNDNLGGGFEAFLHDTWANILSATKGAVYVCMSSSELHTLQRAFVSAGGKWSTSVIWAKHTFTLGRADYQRMYEPILYGWPAGHDRYWCGARDQGDVWFFDKPARNELHPTMKPVALVERAIRNSSKTKDIVLDPFAGSGSTLIACEKAGRRAGLIDSMHGTATSSSGDGRSGRARPRCWKTISSPLWTRPPDGTRAELPDWRRQCRACLTAGRPGGTIPRMPGNAVGQL